MWVSNDDCIVPVSIVLDVSVKQIGDEAFKGIVDLVFVEVLSNSPKGKVGPSCVLDTMLHLVVFDCC